MRVLEQEKTWFRPLWKQILMRLRQRTADGKRIYGDVEDLEEEIEIIKIEERQAYVEKVLLNTVLGLGEKKLTGIFSEEELKEIYQTYYDTKKLDAFTCW